MKNKRQALLAFVMALILAISPTAAFAAGNNATDSYYEWRYIELTPEALEIALQDFTYLTRKILEVAPAQNIIYRRFGISAEVFFFLWRQIIISNEPMPSLLSYFEPERWGDAPTDDLSIAADYLFTILALISMELHGLGHLIPMLGDEVEEVFHALVLTMQDDIEIDQEYLDWLLAEGFTSDEIRNWQASLQFDILHYAIYNTPSVLWFYDLDRTALDLDAYIGEILGFHEPENVTTAIIEPGRIAYIHIESFMGNIAFDSRTLFPFYEEIQDYEHLIIDLRGNEGGWVTHFPTNVVSMLIDEPISFTYYEFFIANDLTAPFFEYPVSMTGANLYAVLPISEFLADRDMSLFNRADAALLDYAIIWNVEIFPARNNIPFGGEIWILVDRYSASASEAAANMAISTGFATVVGEPTAGVTAVVYTYAALPNTGILFRIDLGYTVDQYGRSFEEFGVIPQIRNFFGRDAFETVLDIINDIPQTPVQPPLLTRPGAPTRPIIFEPFGDVPRRNIGGVEFVSIRLVANSLGYAVEWDGSNNAVVVTANDGSYWIVRVNVDGVFNDNGTVLVPFEKAVEMFGGRRSA